VHKKVWELKICKIGGLSNFLKFSKKYFSKTALRNLITFCDVIEALKIYRIVFYLLPKFVSEAFYEFLKIWSLVTCYRQVFVVNICKWYVIVKLFFRTFRICNKKDNLFVQNQKLASLPVIPEVIETRYEHIAVHLMFTSNIASMLQ
jgi:hypothetical protein